MGADLQKLNHRHEHIVEWLVVNGDKTLTQCAAAFGYTIPWISQMVNSDLFQVKYKEMCEERKVAAVHTVSAKMNSAVSLALDKTIEKLGPDGECTEQFLQGATNGLLDRLGYGVKEISVQQHQHLHLTSEDLIRAKDSARERNAS